ncbi:inorganic phosphate transporter [Fervidobacterium thailandense]|uniref:Phosphate transporter n=1 Tax=Fervidobacterium thailandense TaxID=1008305 RepID=A0A1E3G684_9BACT|nr:inorganic phosphate transporter [Fervidobacterium thailandense]ODN31383.1 phosphate transporter [Fervidobacterium thailandense]
MDLILLSLSVALGIVMGANNIGNVVGPIVASGVFKVRRLLFFSSIAAFIGAIIGGRNGIFLNASLGKYDDLEITVIYVASVIVTSFFLRQKLPIALTQVIVGASVGVGVLNGTVDPRSLLFVVVGWFLTPVVAFGFGYLTYAVLAPLLRGVKNLFVRGIILKIALWFFALYGSFSLGANDVGKFAGFLYRRGYSLWEILVLGGLAISFGILSFGNRTVYTVARELMALDDFSSLVCVLSVSMTVSFFSTFGLPISSSHAVFGSMMGVGISRGVRVRNDKVARKILFSWLEAPLLGGLISSSLFSIFRFLW